MKIAAGETVDFPELLTQYRTYLRNTSTRVARGHNRVGAFSTTLQGLDADRNSPSNSSSTSNQQEPRSTKPTPKCICGKKHWYSKCFYLNSDIKVLKSWKPNAAVQKTIQDTLANDLKKKETIEKSIQRFKEKSRKSKGSSTTAALTDSTSSSLIAPNNT